MKKLFGNKKTEEQIIKIMTVTQIPCDIEYVAKNVHMAWGTARSILLSLVIKGKIKCQNTTKGWIFWVEGELGKEKKQP